MTIRLMIRGYLDRRVKFEDPIEIAEGALADLLPHLAETHAKAMAEHRLDMIEIEFLDEPDLEQRFFRIGTNPAGMVIPIGFQL